MEQERLALEKEKENKSKIVNANTENREEVINLPHLLAVSGVYYQCPLISEEVLSKEEWYEKIADFFSAQLSEGEAGLSACLIIHSCNDGPERINNCVETLCKYLDNIHKNPDEQKYWKIRMSNKIFQVCKL